jgi:hypothetical protein
VSDFADLTAPPDVITADSAAPTPLLTDATPDGCHAV